MGGVGPVEDLLSPNLEPGLGQDLHLHVMTKRLLFVFVYKFKGAESQF